MTRHRPSCRLLLRRRECLLVRPLDRGRLRRLQRVENGRHHRAAVDRRERAQQGLLAHGEAEADRALAGCEALRGFAARRLCRLRLLHGLISLLVVFSAVAPKGPMPCPCLASPRLAPPRLAMPRLPLPDLLTPQPRPSAAA